MTKKLNYLLTLAFLVLAGITFCSCSSDDEEKREDDKPTTFSFTAPYMDWTGNIDNVRAYMAANLPDFKEDPEVQKDYSGSHYHFDNKKGNISYSYIFKDDKFKSCSINYYDMNREFEAMKSKVTTTYNIEAWKEQPEMGGVQWWTSEISGNVSVAIGKGNANGFSYMYVDFSHSEF